jgi:membrane associated rhomboid family serine protease/Flp pilus assembly protein TadD
MAYCSRCGAEVSGFSFGSSTRMCAECEKQTAPYRAQAAATSFPSTGGNAVTLGLVIANVVMFGLMVASGVSPAKPSGLDILRWGSDYGPLTLGPEPWRLLSAMFIHIGFIHLLFNMWCLWDLGRLAERVYGRTAYLGLYLASGICGSYLSLAWQPIRSGAGASGAIFGIAGALIAAFKLGNLPLDPEVLKKTLRSVALFAFYNLVIGLAGNINNMAHLGGLIGGLALGYLLTRFFPAGSERYDRALLQIFGVTIVALVLGYFGLRRWKEDVITHGQAELALEKEDCKTAAPLLARALIAQPNNADAHREAAYCYERDSHPQEALREYSRAVELAHDDAYSWNRIGWLRLDAKQPLQASDAFRAAMALDSQSAEPRAGLGIALIDMGAIEDGAKQIEQANASDPENGTVIAALAYAQDHKKLYAEEVKTLRHLIKVAPEDREAHTHLAEALGKSGDAAGAARERQLAEQLKTKQTNEK